MTHHDGLQESDGTLTAEWRRWVEMASAQVIRHIDGAPLVPVSYAFAAQSVKRQEEAAPTPSQRRPHRAKPYEPTAIEHQIIAGVALGMSDAAIGRNVSLLPRIVKKMRERLDARGLLITPDETEDGL